MNRVLWTRFLFGVLAPALLFLSFRYFSTDEGRDGMPDLEMKGWALLGPRTETLTVIISSSTCKAGQTPGYRQAVDLAVELVGKQAREAGTRHRVLGIAVEYDLEAGFNHLQSLSDGFHEVVVGGNWLNSGTEKFIWGNLGEVPGLPQILVVSRTVVQGESTFSVQDEELIFRLVGADQIMAWVDGGAPIRLDVRTTGTGMVGPSGIDAAPKGNRRPG
jgi:hypothetical protein